MNKLITLKGVILIFIWIITNNVNAQIQMNNGIWEEVNLGISNLSISSIAVNSAGVVLIIGHENNGRGGSVLMKSIDEGVNWTTLNPKDSNGNPMVFQNGLFLEAVGKRFYYGWRKYRTSHYSDDNGSNWVWIEDENPNSSTGYFGSQNRVEYAQPKPILFQRNSSSLGRWEKIGEIQNAAHNGWSTDIDCIKVGLYNYSFTGIEGNTYSNFTRPRTPLDNILTGINGFIYVTDKVGGKIYGNNPLSFSIDNGLTWNPIESAKFGVLDIFRTCNNDELFVSAKDGFKPFIAHTQNGGITWKQIDIPDRINKGVFEGNVYPKIKKLEFSPKGTGYLVISIGDFVIDGTRGLYRKANLASCKDIYVEPDFGTTIITHGYQPPNPSHLFPHPIEAGGWAYNIGKEILANWSNNEGCICRYNKTDGNFDVVRGNCSRGETILIFDWMDESNNFSDGYSEAAGDALFSALLLGIKSGKFNLNGIHFIGHSRGTVVNTEAIERLLTLKNSSEHYMNTISIDQVTNLDPHDWGAIDGSIVTDFDNHPNIQIPCPSSTNDYPNNGTIAWKGTGFNDSYFQKGNLDLLDGREVEGTYNVDWSKEAPGHSAIHERYLKTIISKDDHYRDGYKYSRISGKTRPQPRGCGNIKYSPEFDFFEPMKIISDNTNRIRGVMNGSFDRIDTRAYAPGWHEHGGGKSEYPNNNVTFDTGFSSLSYSPNEKEPVYLRHNRNYIPNLAKSIVFKAKTHNLRNGELSIVIVDIGNQQTTTLSPIELGENLLEFKEFGFSVEEFQDKVITFEFQFKGVPLNVDMHPILMISDISISKHMSVDLTKNQEQKTHEINNNEVQFNMGRDATTGITNSTFSDLDKWTFDGGEVGIEKEAVYLRPHKKKQPIVLEYSTFKVPETANYLHYSMHTGNLLKADISVQIYHHDSGKTETIESKKIRTNILNKLNDGLEELNEAIDNLDFDGFKNKFDENKFNISKYRGEIISLKFVYNPVSNGKPKMYIDDVTIE